MKKFAIIVSYCLLSSLFSVGQSISTKLDSFSHISRQFAIPESQYGSAPLWVWNTDVTHELIDSMLLEFKQQAFGGVFVHPRPGLITPYLSKDWFEKWNYALKKGQSLGLDLWIYDENSYPSGFAGGHVQSAMPESYNQGQMLRMQRSTLLPDTSEYFIALLRKSDGHFINVTRNVEFKGRTGDYYLFTKAFYYTSAWYGGFSYVDLMVPGVTEKFLEVTMRNGYEKYAGAALGKSIKGIFSDEPNIEVWDTISIRWTPLLFDAFRKKWDYDLENHLVSLFTETGDWRKTRHDYFATLLDLFIDHWSKPMSRYATEHGLEWTGHYWEHEWPSALHGPDNMAMYAWHQRPGIDMLFNQFDEDSHIAQFGNVRALRELSSVANQLGKKRTLSETYGGSGWELTFKDMKRLGDWEFALGVNTLNQHLAYMSLDGARKYDYPQSFSYHNPWWPYYKGLNEHFSRLSLALSSGKQRNDILIIEPTTTAWMYYAYTKSNSRFEAIGRQFQSFVTRLEKEQVEYDLGSEDIIRRHGRIEGKRFIIGEASYSTVILPPGLESLDEPVFLLLKKFVETGGKLQAYERLQFIDGRKDPRILSLSGKMKQLYFSRIPGGDSLYFLYGQPGLKFSMSAETAGNLYHQRRQLKDGQLLFLVNSSPDQHCQGTVEITGKDAVLLNTFTGELTDYPASNKGNKVNFNFDLPAAGSLLLFIGNDRRKMTKQQQLKQDKSREMPTVPMTIRRMSPNVLTVDFCDLQLPDTTLRHSYFFQATDYLFKVKGFPDGDPWNTSVQFQDQTIRRDTFTSGSGFTVRYQFKVNLKDLPANDVKAVIERAHLWKVAVNGVVVKPITGEWWLDKKFSVLDIRTLLVEGVNEVALTAPKMSVYAEIEPIYIIGDFSLAPDSAGWSIQSSRPLSLGSWKPQGMPLYGHEVSYGLDVDISDTNSHYTLALGEWKGTVAVLLVNDLRVAILIGNEQKVDITSYMRLGKNKIELLVTGSLKNTLGPFYNHPKPGMVSPWHWRYVYRQPPGDEYDLYDYGLLKEMKVLEYR